jgi:UDPglucose 6-dehydrogenase
MNKKATVVGIGRLGLCFAITLERGGYSVVGVDISEDYVNSINNRTFISYEPNVNEDLEKATNLRATTNLEDGINFSDVIFITLRTESMPNGKYDHSQIEKFLEDLIKLGRCEEKKDLVICSNVCPGYSNEVNDRLKDLNYKVSFNPEWVAQGDILFNQAYPDLVVIGEADKDSGDKIEKIYKDICKNNSEIHRMDRLSAEITKIGLNCFLTTKLSYANMIGEIAITSGVNPDPILKAIGTDSRINNKYFKYGFGYGGPCFPRDVRALTYYSDKIGIDSYIVKSVMKTNSEHLKFQISDFVKNNDINIPVVFDSITYKKGVVIIEESQQLLFAEILAKEYNYKVIIRESVEVIKEVKKIYGDIFEYKENN